MRRPESDCLFNALTRATPDYQHITARSRVDTISQGCHPLPLSLLLVLKLLQSLQGAPVPPGVAPADDEPLQRCAALPSKPRDRTHPTAVDEVLEKSAPIRLVTP